MNEKLDKGKISQAVYVYLEPAKDWPKGARTIQLNSRINLDVDPETLKPLGVEFLDCYGVETDAS